MLSMQELEAQSAMELPDRDLMALINILVLDVVDIGDVLVPIGVAANLCGTTVAILAADAADGDTTCTATNTSNAAHSGNAGGNNPNARGGG